MMGKLANGVDQKKDESLERISETFNLALKAHVMFKDEIKNVESMNKQTIESRRKSKDGMS
jgi:hypothetical protein